MNASSGVAPGRARTTCSMSAKTSTVTFGNRLYCDMSRSCPSSSVANQSWPAPTPRSRTISAIAPRIVAPFATSGAGPASRCGVITDAYAHHLDERLPDALIVGPVVQARRRESVRLLQLAVARPHLLRPVHVVAHRQHLAVNALDVVGLAESVDEGLPVARRRDRHRGGAPKLVDPGPRAIGRHRTEEVGERSGRGVEVDEDERAPRLDQYRYQAEIAGVADGSVGERAEFPARRALRAAGRPGRSSNGGTGSGSRSGRVPCPRKARCHGGGTRSGTRGARGRHPERAAPTVRRYGLRGSHPGSLRGRVSTRAATPAARADRSRGRRTRSTCSAPREW